MTTDNTTRIIKRVYAVKDLKIGSFNQPALGDSDAAMIRSFGDMVSSNDSGILNKHPEDFALFYLGSFDCETGVFFNVAGDDIRILANGSDFVKVK